MPNVVNTRYPVLGAGVDIDRRIIPADLSILLNRLLTLFLVVSLYRVGTKTRAALLKFHHCKSSSHNDKQVLRTHDDNE